MLGSFDICYFIVVLLAMWDFLFKKKLQNAITKARMYLERRLKDLSDSYDLAIVTYAFHLVGSSMKDAAFQKLLQKAITSESCILHH